MYIYCITNIFTDKNMFPLNINTNTCKKKKLHTLHSFYIVVQVLYLIQYRAVKKRLIQNKQNPHPHTDKKLLINN